MKLYAVFQKGGARGNYLTRLTQYPPLNKLNKFGGNKLYFCPIFFDNCPNHDLASFHRDARRHSDLM